MTLTVTDWAIVAAYFAVTILIGLYFTRRGSESLSEYFVSGRSATWWLLGTSMVATTFAADTPLLVTGIVATKGVAGNWLWWSYVMSGILTVFFFARLWHRSRVLTDVELAEVRYAGKPAAVLRGMRAVYLGLVMNVIILGWVTRAMVKVLQISLGINPWVAIAICFGITVLYAVAAGLWAVLWTDFVQFGIMMTAVIVLAFYAVHAVGGIDALKAGAAARFGSERAALSVLPVAVHGHSIVAYAWMPIFALSMFLFVQWWATWYPGAEPGGGGYVAQRIFAARSERDGVLATLLFQIAHYAIRPWPWIVTGLATIILYPNLVDKESGYAHAFVDLLPTPWRGLMLAGFAAAYMSTVATQLNWGASYLVNDFYKRFIRRDATERHYVNSSRVATVFLFGVSSVVTWQLTSIEGAWVLLIGLGAGTGLVLMLRWYWWRVNAWSEISAMAGSFVVNLLARQFLLPRFAPGDPNADAAVLLVTVVITTIIWVTVTFATQPERDDVLADFYRRVRPGGRGWARIARQTGLPVEPAAGGGRAWANWVAGIVAVYASLFGIGKVIFGDVAVGIGLLVLGAASLAFISRSLREAKAPAVEPFLSEVG
ncbi:MAG TPA: sodium:solute symporter family protein [Gemmatimonadaceae bacterium]|nr:sodium:solute symporter family protein [Gemmatimonadaceae bacterium]